MSYSSGYVLKEYGKALFMFFCLLPVVINTHGKALWTETCSHCSQCMSDFFLTESNHSCKPHGNWQENVPSCLLQQHEFDMKTLYTVSLFKSFFKFNVLLSKFATSHATQSSIYIDALCEERPVVTLLQLWRKLQTWLIWSEKLLGLTWAMCVGAAISKDEARGTAWPDLAHQSCHARKRGLAYPLTWWKLPLNVT